MSPLSNLHPAPIKINNREYRTVEHYYLQQEALNAGNEELAEKIVTQVDVLKAKQLSKPLKRVDQELKIKWESIRQNIMYEAVSAKFRQNQHLREFLVTTGESKIAESSPYDIFWGTGVRLNDKDAFDPTSWKGENKMGEILENVRKESC